MLIQMLFEIIIFAGMKNPEFQLVKVKTWYLKFNGQIPALPDNAEVRHWTDIDYQEYLKLYTSVGKEWGWTGRLLKPLDELKAILNSDANEVWLFEVGGKLKGFFEIDYSSSKKVEIVYLGLLPDEIGKGLGKSLLNSAINIAAHNNNAVWLHTCEYDHPNALSTYLKAGFSIKSQSIDEEFYPIDFLEKRGII